MNLLAIDTSTMRGSVALLMDGALVMDETFSADRSHTTTLFPLLARARTHTARLDRIAIGLGPGSYAGVRIAIAAAMGMQIALGAELVGIPSVAALEGGGQTYVAIGDARRGTYYFSRVEDGVCVEGPRLLLEPELRILIASASPLPLLASETLATFPEARVAFPAAARIARLAEADRGIVGRGDLEPIYLREPHITRPRTG